MGNMFVVYVLYSEKIKKRYVGHSGNFDFRLESHNEKSARTKGKFTLKNGPWKLVYKEEGFKTRAEAMKREKFLKSGKGREFLNSILLHL